MTSRIHHLDALRGIAALIVAFYHSLRPFADIPRDTNLIAVMNGHTAVMFFFILSGFVLGRSLERDHGFSWPRISGYWIRRFFRLYPLIVFAVLFAALSANFYSSPEQWAKVAAWPERMMELSRDLSGLREYVSCLVLHVSYLNAPLWTIRVELVCSLLLPFVVLAVHGSRWPFLTLLILCIVSLLYYKNTHQVDSSLRYMLHFVLGFTAWKLVPFFEKIGSGFSVAGMVVLSAALFATNYWNLSGLWQTILLFLLFCLLVPCKPAGLKKFLLTPSLQFLGRVSFSFYALHWPVMLLLFSFMQMNLPPDFPSSSVMSKGLLLFALSSVAALFLAKLTERFVERPTNHLGHSLCRHWVSWCESRFCRQS